MARQRLALGALLAGVSALGACTHDFTGYHLESSDAGSSGVEAGAGGAPAQGGTSSNLGGGHTSGGAGNAAGDHGDAGGRADAGSSAQAGSGEAGSGEAGGGGENPIILLTGTPPSCLGLSATCGPDRKTSCCAASLVPGGTYDRSNLAVAPATVSDFGLDQYEVSVGRFRNFVKAYTQAATQAGSGRNPNNLMLDPGWNAAWNAKLPATAAALSTTVKCDNGTFTPEPGANESLPMTCLSWYEAFAFCIWDGGRLPTEAEWNYAAAGGSEERSHPWGNSVPDDDHAVFCPGSCGVMQTVGTKAPKGGGKWGQVDLVGNVWEWNVDVFVSPYPQSTCQDCATTTASASSTRVFRGGSAANGAAVLLSATRNSRDPNDHNAFIGVRCARNP